MNGGFELAPTQNQADLRDPGGTPVHGAKLMESLPDRANPLDFGWGLFQNRRSYVVSVQNTLLSEPPRTRTALFGRPAGR